MTRNAPRARGLRTLLRFAASTILVFAAAVLPCRSQDAGAAPGRAQDAPVPKKEKAQEGRLLPEQTELRKRWEQEQRNRASQESRDRVEERKRHESERAERDKRRNNEQKIEREERTRRRPSGPKPPPIDRGPLEGKGYARRLPRPDKDFAQRRTPTDDHQATPPEKDGSGEPIKQSPSKISPRLTRIVNNIAVINAIKLVSGTETGVGAYYWHDDGGIRWCHYTDHSGRRWFGFYSDDDYYWVRYDDGNWWLHDKSENRWSFWHDGYWWYHGLQGAYVYIGSAYYRYQENNDRVILDAEKRAAGNESDYFDPGGLRAVQITGAKKEAFLYDLIPGEWSYAPEYLTSLGSGVEDVRFAYTADWVPKEHSLRIITIHAEGTVRLFDSDGHFVRSRRFQKFGFSTDPVALILDEKAGDFDPGFTPKIRIPSILPAFDASDRELKGGGFFDGR